MWWLWVSEDLSSAKSMLEKLEEEENWPILLLLRVLIPLPYEERCVIKATRRGALDWRVLDQEMIIQKLWQHCIEWKKA